MTIRPLRPNETRVASEVAARAFFGDPLFTHIYPDPERRRWGFALEHAAYIRRIYQPLGTVEVAEVDDTIRGLALWLPPGAESPWWREFLLLPTLARAVGVRRVLPTLADYRAFDAVWPEGRFWYLGLLAVEPAAQGRGIGGALLRRGLAWADRDGAGAFLETGTAENVAFYRGYGFRVTDEVALPHGPPHWAMWREPGA